MNYADALARNIAAQADNIAAVLTAHQSEGAVLQRAAQLLKSASLIVFTGMGASYAACIPAVKFLNKHGVNAILLEASELSHYAAQAFTDAAFVLVSRSGESAEIINLLHQLNERKNIVVGVSNDVDSTLAGESTVSLSIHSMPDHLIAIQTYTATLLTLLLMANEILDLPFHREAHLIPQAMQSTLDRHLSESQTWQAFLESPPVIYLLGRGLSLGAVHNGALLFHEVAKLPAVGMEAGQFRHGPVEVASAALSAIVFAPPDATETLNLGLVDDLRKMGADVRFVGVSDEMASLCWKLPGTITIPAVFVPLLEIIPVQIAAWRAAGWRGIEAGKLLITPLVTKSETGFGERP